MSYSKNTRGGINNEKRDLKVQKQTKGDPEKRTNKRDENLKVQPTRRDRGKEPYGSSSRPSKEKPARIYTSVWVSMGGMTVFKVSRSVGACS